MSEHPTNLRPYKPLIAALWALGTLVSFTSMSVAGREAGRTLDTFEIMTYRSLIGVLIVVSIIVARKRQADIRTNRLGLHLLRNVCHFSGQNLWLYALTVIPLAQVAVLEFSYPVWVALAAPFVLGEQITARRVLSVLLGFTGILLVVRPGIMPINAGTTAALMCAFGFAGAALCTRKLTEDQTTLCVMFWLTAMQAVMGLGMAGYDGVIALPSAEALPFVIIVGIAGLAGHYCLTTALSLAPASLVMPMEFLRLPTMAIVGALLYFEPLDPFVLVGSTIILAANLMNLWKPRQSKQV
ncbi:DMT family transporter [Meridianimarinicoccus aquatilis]|uniref:DMT family transporter n=1 Tax=Meridianimarinicoccus aquatilis TaxID=2552766 RepID=A0A4R6AY43_9RHOB|nr:DMT family transporter [Fluviibacterium aquatile]QIE42552.1 DMT family transporter [Rhodobacteraceae bacterium SC52]TDL89167.1 DMT family transporter [Fluviibacterium aquatile]